MLSIWWWVLASVACGYLGVLIATLIPSKPQDVTDVDPKTAAKLGTVGNASVPSYARDATIMSGDEGRATLLRPISPSEPYSTTLRPM